MKDKSLEKANLKLEAENKELTKRLAEADEQLNAISRGEIDALVFTDKDSQKLVVLNSIILDEISEGAVTITRDGVIKYSNQQFSDFISIPIEQLIETNISLLITGSDKEKFQKLQKQSIQSRLKSELKFVNRDNKDEHYYFSFSPLPSNSVGEICIVVSNITELKKKETELQISNNIMEKLVKERTKKLSETIEDLTNSKIAALNLVEDALESKNSLEITNKKLMEEIIERKKAENELLKLSRAVEQSPASIIITDIKGNIEYVNPKLVEITGYQLAEVIGKNSRIFSSGEKPKSEYKILWDTITSGKEWRGEFHNKKKNGELYWELATISPIINEKGDVINFLAVKEDITERKKIAEELIRAKEKAEESDKLKSEFLAQMSHEIRTPINAVLGYTEYLNDLLDYEKDSEFDECFNGINLASKRIIRTIDLLLNASELQTGRYLPHFHQIDLDTEILNKLYKEQLFNANQRGLELIYKCKLNDPEILADEYSATQIFANLIDNAIKYTKKGKVEILLTKNKNDNVVVEIKDTGIGIAKEFLPRLFNPFAQEEQGYSRSFEGNGLGLALVQKYCEINHTKIEVDSEKNVGTTFRVTFDKKFNVN